MKYLTKNRGCRMCKSTQLMRVFRFGPQPLANAFLSKLQLSIKEQYYPLDVYFCKKCHLLQLRDIVSPKILFKDYVYVSSTSPVFIQHFENFSNKIVTNFELNNQSLVIDIGSNDGILLKPYLKSGVKVLGIEPAKNIAKIARNENIETITEFFSVSLAYNVIKKYGKAHVITATNVFAHINDLDEVMNGVKVLLNDNGVFIIEAPYLIDFLASNLFDTVYHEHLSYLSLSPLIPYVERFDLRIFDVERVASHGGSLRIYVTKQSSIHKISPNVKKLLLLEKKRKLHLLGTYRLFAKRVEQNKVKLLKLMNKLKSMKKSIVGYGAPAKGNTLLNYFEIKANFLDYIVDDSVFKQGLYTPGAHISVVSPSVLEKYKPDYILILAWNFAESIVKKYSYLKKKGVKFILPMPEPKII